MLQTIKTGTYEDALGPGTTPPWGSFSDVMKYQADSLVEHEAGFSLNYSVSSSRPASEALTLLHVHILAPALQCIMYLLLPTP